MADMTITAATPFVITLDGTVEGFSVVADLRPSALVDAGGALVADENLADVADADAALANLGGASADLSTAAGVSAALGDYANDAAAAVGGVGVGELYRNGSVLMVRVA